MAHLTTFTRKSCIFLIFLAYVELRYIYLDDKIIRTDSNIVQVIPAAVAPPDLNEKEPPRWRQPTHPHGGSKLVHLSPVLSDQHPGGGSVSMQLSGEGTQGKGGWRWWWSLWRGEAASGGGEGQNWLENVHSGSLNTPDDEKLSFHYRNNHHCLKSLWWGWGKWSIITAIILCEKKVQN